MAVMVVGMKQITKYFALLCLTLFAGAAFAQASLPVDVTSFGDGQAFEYFLKGLGGLKGAGALPIAAFVTQLALFAVSRFGPSLLGKWQLLVVGALSCVTLFVATIATGMPWTVALMSGPVLAGLQVLIHQGIVQFSPAKVAADKAGQA